MADGTIPLETVIAKCDELFNAEKKTELGEHLRFWRNEARKKKDKRGELALLNEMMGHYRMGGDRERGLAAVEDGLDLIRELGVSETLSAGTILLNAATALQSFGDTGCALELYRRCAEIYEKHLDPDDGRIAGLFNNMAAAFAANGEFAEAEDLYLRALDILKVGRNFNDSAVTCLNLAQLYRSRGSDPELVSGTLECAFECFERPDDERDGYYAHTCRKCASGFGALGRPDLEEELNKRADAYYESH